MKGKAGADRKKYRRTEKNRKEERKKTERKNGKKQKGRTEKNRKEERKKIERKNEKEFKKKMGRRRKIRSNIRAPVNVNMSALRDHGVHGNVGLFRGDFADKLKIVTDA